MNALAHLLALPVLPCFEQVVKQASMVLVVLITHCNTQLPTPRQLSLGIAMSGSALPAMSAPISALLFEPPPQFANTNPPTAARAKARNICFRMCTTLQL